jgi:endonuclease G
MLVSVKQLKKETNQSPEVSDVLKNKSEIDFTEEFKVNHQEKSVIENITKDNLLNRDENLEKRKEMISAKAIEPVDFAFERAIGKNDSLYSNFIELIALTKRKVGRIVVIENNKKTGYATGFMVSKELMLTNYHVFNNESMAEESEIHFFYEYDAEGRPITPVIFKFDTSKFFNNEALDYCFVGVHPVDITAKVSLSTIGYLYLDKALGKIGDVNVEKLNIIHHPLGDYKQLSIRENLFDGIDDTKIYYKTDTAQGSSGSPVFNDQWQVVGLHHKSVAKMSSDGKDYLDENGEVIPSIDGKIDIARVVWIKNEGIRISVVLKHLEEKNQNNSVIKGLAIPPVQENISFLTNNRISEIENNQNNKSTKNDSDRSINISVPVDVFNSEDSIDISLSTKKNNATANGSSFIETVKDSNSEMLLEIAKIDKENAVSFNECQGYKADFLGINISMPQPTKKIENEIALLKDKSKELKYFNYSVIFNAVRRMPLISAINVEGDAALRLDDSKRKDDWLRDNRIDIECQLFDKFYSKSKFDKGHMGRFEDANWDTTEAKALRNGIYTCFYTNACPQVPDINRTGDNLWGNLEKTILEKGIKKEHGKQAKMTVFNGPIFEKDEERIFKGVRIPMSFFKIILWLNDNNQLKATAFKLSQENLVGQISFDESMRLDDEGLDIDEVVVFKNYQCSIKSLIALTEIDFQDLVKYDTYVLNGSDEMLLINNEKLML